ncbi:Zn(II)2Cys6 transcription factor [Aspergillus undulatus]|uniref:Zn(II)2Cys6 transcription factor n=1 Tax=Aspergillus undulatus TaxID=1810928 RepID=UPI003CCD296C
MAEAESAAPNFRIPKACQECRQRKIKCNGENPCKTCRLRRAPCVYREVIRQRKRKDHGQRNTEESAMSDVPARPDPLQSHREEPLSFSNNVAVSATHMTSPSNKVQLYYGSTSHFALVHEIYRDLTSHPSSQVDPGPRPHGRVEEAGAGLDMLSFRTIFFGIPTDRLKDPSRGPNSSDPNILFLSYELASSFLQSFFCTLYHLLPIWPTEVFQRRLGELYGSRPPSRTDINQYVLLMALALGALVTQHHAWGDALYERVKSCCNSFDDTVNLQTVQLFMFMAHFQNEVGRPNSCFLHLGSAARRAISAGLHKESPHDNGDAENSTERRRTFWYLYIYESWICFHLGRPSSLSRKDVGIPLPGDPFCETLIFLSDSICRSADELYGRHQESLLQMWRIAKSIWDDLRTFDARMQRALGFGLDKRPQQGAVGVQQTMFITLYYHTILLTFRPFLIFRGRWNENTRATHDPANVTTKREIPPWLNEACSYALSAACRTIYFLCESYTTNELIRGIRYHAFFLTSSCFAVIFDLMHGKDLAASHLPWVHATLKALTSMSQSDAVEASILAIQTTLKQMDPTWEWVPHPETGSAGYTSNDKPAVTQPYNIGPSQDTPNTGPLPSASLPMHPQQPQPLLYDFQGNPLEQSMHMPSASGSIGSGEDLLDFTLSDMGWDFDFSTMDLESFFSISPAFDAPSL